MALTLAPSTDAGVLDFFFGSGEDSTEEEVEIEDDVDIPEGAGLFLNNEEYEMGKRGFYCLQDLAGIENEEEWGSRLMGPIARVMLAAYGEDGIDTICQSKLLTRMRARKHATDNNERKRNLREHVPTSVTNNITNPERDLSTCSSFPAQYVAKGVEQGGSNVYADFARENLDDYLNSDRTMRTSAVKTFSLQDQAVTVRRAQQVFSRCTRLWTTINNFIAAPDVPGVNQEAISEAVQSFVCDLPSTYSNIAALRLQRDQELINFHNELVNGAEVGAMYKNTNSLMKEICERDSRMEVVMDEIADIKRTINRM